MDGTVYVHIIDRTWASGWRFWKLP